MLCVVRCLVASLDSVLLLPPVRPQALKSKIIIYIAKCPLEGKITLVWEPAVFRLVNFLWCSCSVEQSSRHWKALSDGSIYNFYLHGIPLYLCSSLVLKCTLSHTELDNKANQAVSHDTGCCSSLTNCFGHYSSSITMQKCKTRA